MQRSHRIFISWLLLAAVVFFSVSPIQFKPENFISISVDQVLACAFLTLLLTLAYPRRIGIILAGIVTIPTLFEIVQIFEVGRHATSEDIVLKVAGGLFGLVLGLVAIRLSLVFQAVTRHRDAVRERHRRYDR